MVENGWGAAITSPEAMLKGFIAGFLIGSGVFCQQFGGAAQVLLFAVGVACLLDAVIPRAKNMHGFTVAVFALVGGLVSFPASASASAAAFVIIAVIIAVLLHVKGVFTGLRILKK